MTMPSGVDVLIFLAVCTFVMKVVRATAAVATWLLLGYQGVTLHSGPCLPPFVKYIYCNIHTNQRKAIIATLPLLRVHPMNHRQSPALARNKKTNTLQQHMFISGHTHARPEPRPAGLFKV
jgi:hypothetical protein